MVVRRVVRRLLLFSRFPVGTGGGNCVTMGLFNVRFRGFDEERTSSIDRFSVFRNVFVGRCRSSPSCSSSSLHISIDQKKISPMFVVFFLTSQQMQWTVICSFHH